VRFKIIWAMLKPVGANLKLFGAILNIFGVICKLCVHLVSGMRARVERLVRHLGAHTSRALA
jgi:hypothetical protein